MIIVHVEDYFDPTAGYQINELLFASKNFSDKVFLITSTDMTPFHKQVDMKDDIDFENETGVKIIRLKPIFKISSRLILKKFKSTIKSINPDLVFMHGIGDFKDLQLFKAKAKYKIVRDCHMSWVASKNKLRKIYFLLFKVFFARIINSNNKYEVIYALGDEELEYLLKLGIKESKIDFLKHGFNDSIIYYDENERKSKRLEYGFKDNEIVLSYIGKFNYSKRPDLIIDILQDLNIVNQKLSILFIGSKDRDYMKFFNEKLKTVQNKFNIVIDDSKPFRELRKYYSASDICIFPKQTTLSSIHAQICGCPVVMEKHKSNIERVIDTENLFEISNISEARKILERIINNNDYLKTENLRKIKLLSNREYKNQIEKLRMLLDSSS